MLVDLKNGKKFYSPDEQKVKATHDALVAGLRAIDPATKATVVAQSLAAVLCMVYEVSGHRHAADAMETWFAEELEWPDKTKRATRRIVKEQEMNYNEKKYWIEVSDALSEAERVQFAKDLLDLERQGVIEYRDGRWGLVEQIKKEKN